MKTTALALLMVALLPAAQAKPSFTGVITDDMCATGDHSRMRMGSNDAECTRACVAAHAAAYVLFDGKTAYVLDDQNTPERFAGQKVRIVGRLDAEKMTIHVESITAEP